MISALTSALYRLVECLDEANTYNLHFNRDTIDEAAAEIWRHLSRARIHAGLDNQPCDVCVGGKRAAGDDCAVCLGTGGDPGAANGGVN